MAKEPANKKDKKVKRPTPLKRDEQSLKRNLRNRIVKSQVATAIRSYNDAVKTGNKEDATAKLNSAYSVLDKAAQKGVLKKNKSSRTKARLAARTI